MRQSQVCDHCGGRFGLVTHRWWGNKFCKRTCKAAYLRELALDRDTIRRWFGLPHGTDLSQQFIDETCSIIDRAQNILMSILVQITWIVVLAVVCCSAPRADEHPSRPLDIIEGLVTDTRRQVPVPYGSDEPQGGPATMPQGRQGFSRLSRPQNLAWEASQAPAVGVFFGQRVELSFGSCPASRLLRPCE